MKSIRVTGRAFASALFLCSLSIAPSCMWMEQSVRGPMDTYVQVPAAQPGQLEQFQVVASANAHAEAGIRAMRNNEWDIAITAFKQALTENSSDERSRFALGLAYEMSGDLQHALEQFQLAQKLSATPNKAYDMCVARVTAKRGG